MNEMAILAGLQPARNEVPPSGDIAIIGMAGRFPGAQNVEALWQLVRCGHSIFTRFSPDEIEDSFDEATRASPDYVAARPFLEDVDRFDAGFFGMLPREASVTDPQQRIFLEIAWEAFEDAGYDPAAYGGNVGVFAGAALSTYLLNNVLGDRTKVEEFTSNYQVGCYPIYVGAIADTLATRIAHKLDLRGPAVTMLTACSTSLLCVAEACQSLLCRRSDMALAGGVSITFPQKRGYIHQAGGMVSPDGICRPFDAAAAGTVFGSGAGIVLLKRLEDALADGDHIDAVIRGFGINNDGASKVSYTGPSALGQAAAIRAAHENACVDPSTIGYIECHGTATPLGDPIEFLGLSEAFRGVERDRHCALGSIKGNVGHLDAAAGITGLIKSALMLREREIPPLAQFRQINPDIDIEKSPFYVETRLTAWPEGPSPRRAGVSSFGIGGTNVHIVLEEPPRSSETVGVKSENDFTIVPVSARCEKALKEACISLAAKLEKGTTPALADIAFTLQEGRREFRHRAAFVCHDREDLARTLSSPATIRGHADETPPDVIYMFPGQGSQYPGMASGLYSSDRDFARCIDDGAAILEPLLGFDIRTLICRDVKGEDAARALKDTQVTQPALFLTEYATARLWINRGLVPSAMIGHSIGELVAAAISGVVGFEDALHLIAHRGRLMQNCPTGAMLSVRAPEEEVRGLLGPEVDLAALNAPKLSVVAGSFPAIEEFEAILAKTGLQSSRLHTSHAFHSFMMDTVVDALREQAAKIEFFEPQIPFVSGVTGKWAGEEVLSPDYWARHCRATVRFADALRTVCSGRKPVLLEVGPGRTLSTFAAQIVKRENLSAVVTSLPDHERPIKDEQSIAEAHARLWSVGARLEWPRSGDERRVRLPTYPFQRERHWIDAPRPLSRSAPQPRSETSAAPPNVENAAMNSKPGITIQSRAERIETTLIEILAALSGQDATELPRDASFVELGFDSLFLGQFSQELQKKFGLKISFRQLLGDIPSALALAVHLDRELPPDAPSVPPPPVPLEIAVPAAFAATTPPPVASTTATASAGIEGILHGQIHAMQAIFSEQILALSRLAVTTPVTEGPAISPAHPPLTVAAAKDVEASPSRFRMYKPGSTASQSEPAPEAKAFIADLVARFSARNPTSKAMTQNARARLADPRTAAGFRPAWKEAVFPIVAASSKGSRIRDVDGNEYVDVVSGYGQTAFGHAPDFVTDAIAEQLAKGFAIGPQSPLAGEVAEDIGQMTGHERVTFCNTGSEAVMAAMRVARSVTGRDRVVVFSDDYHGQFDEVLVKGNARSSAGTALPIAPGIPANSLGNMSVLPYGAPESLDWISRYASDIAAVLIEPVQSRHPELQPVEFVHELRRLTTNKDIALIFDEVVSGFRVAPGGVQSLWGIKGDMATYGKVLGGGMPLGILAGSARFMDALDGGAWRYGDASEPEVSPTFFAGTFVRHPLALAAARAVLNHIKGEGRALYDRVAPRTAALVAEINADLERRGVPAKAETFSSWFMINFGNCDPLGSVIYTQFRQMGLHIQEGFPCYLTTAHTEEDLAFIANVFREGVDAVQSGRILCPPSHQPASRKEKLAPVNAVDGGPTSASLTEPQMEIWLAAQMGSEASAAFNESFSITLEGLLDEASLRAAIADVVRRHDALRTVFAKDGRSQSVVPDFVPDLMVIDLTGTSDDAGPLMAFLAEDARLPFDMTSAPPVRAALLHLAADRNVLVFTAHHIICDGWSSNIVAQDIAEAYTARLAGSAPNFPSAPSFLHHAKERAAASPFSSEAEIYWLNRFDTVPDPLDLPFDRERPEHRSFAGATLTRQFDGDFLQRIKEAGARQGCTLFSTLLAALHILLGRLSGQDDLAIAIPSAGQSLNENDGLVGHCVNLLPIRLRSGGGTSVRDHFKAMQTLVSDAFEYRDYTYGTLVRKLDIERTPGALPITQIQFNLERLPGELHFDSLVAHMTPNPKAFSNFDMFLNMIESTEGLRIDVDYNTDLLEEATVSRWIDCFETLLGALADGEAKTIGDLPIVSEIEGRWLVDELNQTKVTAEADETVVEMFARQAAKRPDAVAVRRGDFELTYRELDERSNRLARHLNSQIGPAPQHISVAVDRSIDMIVALLAVMKAGHTYIPLDPTHPGNRLALAMETASIGALICHSDKIAELCPEGVRTIRLDREHEAIDLQDAGPLPRLVGDGAASAYIIFTSGSTGVPKGVEVPHRALTNFLRSMAKEPGFTAEDSIVALTTISFDIAALELYLPLICGGTIILADRLEVTDGFALVERIRTGGASVVQATPTLWSMLLEAGFQPNPSVRMLCGGENLPRDLADRLIKGGGELWNMYGPTETTIWSSVERVRGDKPITIGHPIDNTTLHILSPEGRLQPIGVVGELYIGGLGLAHGYIGREELTAQSFRDVVLPGHPSQRLYKTGDVGRRLADGSLQLLGRRDNQVKLRGFRIELGDIENVLRKAPGIKAAAVDVKERTTGDRQLVGYYVAAPGASPEPEVLTAHVAEHLPHYMVPAAWVTLTALPETANGKLDRKALPLPLPTAHSSEPITVKFQPQNGLETQLADIWKDVLGLTDIDVSRNIFALGADSLSVFRIAARMTDQGLNLDARDLLRFPSIQELARHAAGSPNTAPARRSLSLSDFGNGAHRNARRLT